VETHWDPIFALLHAMDRDIAALYTDAGIVGLRPRYVGPLLTLARHGAMSVQALADSSGVTHSAMSQTVAALRRDGFVDTAPSTDGRHRRIQLSAKARELLPFLDAEWRATAAAVRELDAELPYPLSNIARDIAAALARRPFRQRLADHLATRAPAP
jgi:DNA-binding MarR family transcriptional regulator